MFETVYFLLPSNNINTPFQFIDIDCGPLPPLEHGSIILSESRNTYGVQATYSCHENYTLIGNENRTCETQGWTGKQPECLVDWCPEPPQISGGSVTVNDKRAGSTATYVCEPGYVLVGEPVSILLFRNIPVFKEIFKLVDYILWFGR